MIAFVHTRFVQVDISTFSVTEIKTEYIISGANVACALCNKVKNAVAKRE
jgi:hypothetical protein